MMSPTYIYFLIYINIVYSAAAPDAASSSVISRLRKDILMNYDPHSRPVQNHKDRTTIALEFAPLHLTELDEMRGIMTIEVYLNLEWSDPHLVWEPEKYDGLSVIHFAEGEIWKPDITVYESIGAEVDHFHNVHLVVNNTGYVRWNPPATLNTICPIDFTDYPNDAQECSLTLGSWSYHGEYVDIVIDKNDTIIMNQLLIMENTNPNWKVLSITTEKVMNLYEEFERRNKVPTIEYTIKIVRRGYAEEDMVALPRVMSLLILLTMFVVPQGIEFLTTKLLLGCISLLIQITLIFLVAMNVPAVACLTNGLRALKCSFALSAIAIISQVLIVNLASCNSCSPPEPIMRLFSPKIINYLVCFCGGSASTSSTVQEDGTTRVVDTMDPRKKDWLILSSLLDRLALVIFFFLCLVTGAFW